MFFIFLIICFIYVKYNSDGRIYEEQQNIMGANKTKVLLLQMVFWKVFALCSLSVWLKLFTKGTEGTLDVNMISYINLVAGLLHYFLLNHAYK